MLFLHVGENNLPHGSEAELTDVTFVDLGHIACILSDSRMAWVDWLSWRVLRGAVTPNISRWKINTTVPRVMQLSEGRFIGQPRI